MKVAFRTDASSVIGTGHFMRCFTLAVELKRCKAQIIFICRNLPDYLSKMLTLNGIELELLFSPQNEMQVDELAHASWLGVSQVEDAADSIEMLSKGEWDWLVIDHYALDYRWESLIRQRVKKIIVIDDIADRQHDCDVLLDQNFYTNMEERYKDLVPVHCQLLLGPRYALLRSEFREERNHVKPRKGSVKRILVFFGGIDNENFTGKAIDALLEIDLVGLYVDVVIGSQHPYKEKIETSCLKHGFCLHVQTNKMAELMANSDLAIGAGGSASWERCCVGLPAVLIAIADNQIDIAMGLDSYGACVFVGTSKTINISILRNAIVNIMNGQDQLNTLSKKSLLLVDGMGIDRVYKVLDC